MGKMPWREKGELRMRGNLDQRPSRECHSSREQAMHWLQSFSSSSSHFGARVSVLPRQLEMERILGPFNSPLQMNKQTWWGGWGERRTFSLAFLELLQMNPISSNSISTCELLPTVENGLHAAEIPMATPPEAGNNGHDEQTSKFSIPR